MSRWFLVIPVEILIWQLKSPDIAARQFMMTPGARQFMIIPGARQIMVTPGARQFVVTLGLDSLWYGNSRG